MINELFFLIDKIVRLSIILESYLNKNCKLFKILNK